MNLPEVIRRLRDINATDDITRLRIESLVASLEEPGKGVNPVTIPGVGKHGQKANLTVARLWLDGPSPIVSDGQQRAGVGVPAVERRQKFVTAMIWDGSPDKPNIVGTVKLNEDDLIRALAQVFPLRELWESSSADEVNADLLLKMMKERL